jgi:hypothetical protein
MPKIADARFPDSEALAIIVDEKVAAVVDYLSKRVRPIEGVIGHERNE